MEALKNLSLENLPEEEWRDVVGYEGLYQVSNLGRVKSIIKERIMAQHDNGNGYLTVSLSMKGKIKKEYIHRLVAEAFIPNPNDKPEVNHLNLKKNDNNIQNLEWNTKKENMNHARCNGVFKDVKVYQYSLDGVYEKEFNSLKEAATFHNVKSIGDICRSCKGQRKICKNHIFIYYKSDKILIPKKEFKRVIAKKQDVTIEFDSAKEASLYLGVKENSIVCSCLRKTKCKGFILNYK